MFIILFTQNNTLKKTQNNKENILNLTVQDLEKFSTTASIQGLALSEQVRRVSDCGRKRKWEMIELKDCQQQEMEGKLQFHSHPMLTTQVLVP